MDLLKSVQLLCQQWEIKHFYYRADNQQDNFRSMQWLA